MTRAQTRDVQALSVELPLPDGRIGPNGREGWRNRSKLVRDHREDAGWATSYAINDAVGYDSDWEPWPAARMDIEWRYCGNPADSDNIVARCKAYRDGAADAGLVADDRSITIGTIALTRTTRALQGVVLTFSRMDAETEA